MKIERSLRPIHGRIFILFFIVLLGACSPTLYKRPAEDFKEASTTLRDSYFLEWEISNRAFIERGDLEDQIAIWIAPASVPTAELKRMSDRMAERRQSDIHKQLRPLREQAFNALDGYASTLVSLASDEPTEQIQSELTGLVSDLSATVDAAGKLSLVGDDLAKLKKFTGPLQQYVGVLNEIITLVSNLVRERAIIETIGKSNESIMDLLSVLKEEAATARQNALSQTALASQSIDRYMAHGKFQKVSNNTKAEVTKRKAQLQSIEQQLASQDIASVFDAAMKAQGALVEKAMLKSPGDWTVRIKRFREQVTATKTAIEKIRSEM